MTSLTDQKFTRETFFGKVVTTVPKESVQKEE